MTFALWTCDEIAAATDGELLSGNDWQVSGVSIDSRTLVKGDLFVALNVDRDGHEFVSSANKAGAIASIVSRNDVVGAKVLVSDPLQALTQLGMAARKRSAATRIAITGSVGKTSVKDVLAKVLAANGTTHKSTQSYNNQWGVPLSMARMPTNSKWAVFEIGTNSPGEIASLSGMVRPNIGIITRIAEAHLAGFGTIDAIAREKASIWAALTDDGIAVLPGSGPMADILLAQVKCFGVKNLWKFGTTDDCDVRIVNWDTAITGSRGVFDIRGDRVEISAPVSGMHWSEVFAAVMASAVAIGLNPQQVAQTLQEVTAPDGRGTLSELQLVDGGVATLIDDSYNANPASMKAALDTLSRFSAPRKLAVLGEMLELGPMEARLHGELSWSIEQAGICKVWCVGELMRYLTEKLPLNRQAIVPDDIADLVNLIYADLQDGDILLVKGSNGSGVHRVARGLLQRAAEISKGKGRS
ncbi:MAG: UDP-N-acetylmuramoyl-tripeptide--D-alanyl-D-alanine ligase [Robiginitomaculum sp.]|nr:UDP-N-acetylmuramoyl-tripeptide--D-alanyl-D-alanine ligase [Robiginitomaculum sp.]